MLGLGTENNHLEMHLLERRVSKISLLTYGNEAFKNFGFLENPRPLVSGEPTKS